MLIDAHTHVASPDLIAHLDAYKRRDDYFDLLYSSPKARLATAESLIGAMDADGVDRAVISGFGWCDARMCCDDNDYVIDAVRRYPSRLVGLAVVTPSDGTAAVAEIERCAAAGLRGVGELMPDGQKFDLDDVDLLRPVAEAVAALGLVMMTHTSEPVGHSYPGKGTVRAEAIVRFAGQFPDVRLICAHWGGGVPFFELMPEVKQTLRNVYYDTAASPLLYSDEVFRIGMALAPSKVLFGTDFPLLRAGALIDRIRRSGLSQAEEAALLGGNVARVFGLR